MRKGTLGCAFWEPSTALCAVIQKGQEANSKDSGTLSHWRDCAGLHEPLLVAFIDKYPFLHVLAQVM